MTIPARYNYLVTDFVPPIMVRAAMGMYGTYENLNDGQSNPYILAWADEIERICPSAYDKWAADYYNSDRIPWCGLFAAVCAARSCQARPERFPPKGYLAALSWSGWGVGVSRSLSNILVGDVIVFTNPTHVSIAVGVTNQNTVVCLGGNQTNSVRISEYAYSRVYAIRRPSYINRPDGARHVVVGSTGILSESDR